MTTRYLTALCVMAALAFACGPHPRAAERQTKHRKHHAGDPALVTKLDVAVQEGVRFAFRVTNETDKSIEVDFGSGQTHDIAVLDSTGREVWRWSEGRLFTSAIRNRPLGVDETMTFEERWEPGLGRGRYTAVAVLKSVNYPVTERAEFEIGGATLAARD